MAPVTPHLPRQVPIEAYGNGGFRFADMSHRGSLLSLPSGLWAWDPRRPEDIDEAALARVAAEASAIDIFILGTGPSIWAMPESLRWHLRDLRVGLEILSTGAAVRTYNILLGERRRVAAAFIAVD
ncbi:MAG: Mth938-like domain-containing protein [Variibacter sp.]|nr:Mth938-like domain-containing protein [Variibacter sp.]